MSLLRPVARTMLASYFVLNGIKAVRTPDQFVSEAEPVADRMVPAIKKVAPDSIAGFVPEDTATLVRIDGAVQIVGGLALATGKGRRLGALLLAGSLIPGTLARHPFWTRESGHKAEDANQFLKNVSLLGGVLLASVDTEGKPSLAWRAQAGGERAARKTRKAGKKAKRALSGSNSLASSVEKTGKSLSKNTQELAGAAVAGSLGLIEEVTKQSRRARKKARKQAKKTAAITRQRAEEARKQARKQAKKTGKKTGKKASKKAGKLADSTGSDLGKQLADLRSTAQDQAKAAQKQAASVAKDVSKSVTKSAGKLTENIQLGAN